MPLSAPPTIDPALVQAYRSDGHVLVRGLLDADAVREMRPVVMAAVQRSGRLGIDLSTLPDAYSRAFVQVVNAGLQDPAVRRLTHSPRLGAWVAALVGAGGARILLEDTFLKPPGAGPTPWHQDASVSPMEPDRVLTAWIPLQPVEPHMGGLRYVTASHRDGLLGPVDISEDSQAFFDQLIEDRGLEVVDLPGMEPGDVCFHSGQLVHGAYDNRSDQPRLAIALHCFADGATIVPVRSDNQARLLAELGPGLQVGDVAVSPAWPRTFPVQP